MHGFGLRASDHHCTTVIGIRSLPRSLAVDRLAQRPVSPVGEGIELRRLLLLLFETALKGGELQLEPGSPSLFLVLCRVS